MRLMALAGEQSGDAHGGALLTQLRQRVPHLQAFGVGGEHMRAAGLEPVFPLSELQVHGLVEVMAHLPRLYRLLWRLEAEMRRRRPDAVLLIDYPGFNLKVAAAARRQGLPVLYYCSPQVWAWRGGRLRTIARLVDKMVVLFPFEVPLYQRVGVDASFVGHPLLNQSADPDRVAALRRELNAGEDEPVVAVLPGSRPSELARHLPPVLEGLRLLAQEGFRARYVLPVAPTLERATVERMLAGAPVPVHVADDAFLAALEVAHLAVVASGTATLQAAMAQVPFVVIYKVAPLTYRLARRFAYVQHVSIVNILAGREVAPELLQDAFTPQALRDALLALARDPQRQEVTRRALGEVTAQLGEPGAYGRAAEEYLRFLRQRQAQAASAAG